MAIGCQGSAGGAAAKIVDAEPNDLGISYLEIGRSSLADESTLTIRGFTINGEEVATATLRTGWVAYSYTDDPLDGPPARGRELSIVAGNATLLHVSPDLEAHEAPAPEKPQLVSFVRLRGVAAELDQEAKIRFPQGEVAFQTYTCLGCDAKVFPTNVAESAQCGMLVGNSDNRILSSRHVIAAGSKAGMISWSTYSTSCRTSSGGTSCSSDCFYGPCGANRTPSGTGIGKVFHPSSGDGNNCGWDDNISYSPEDYVSQTVWDPQPASCTCTGCSNGTPTPAGCTYPTNLDYSGW